METSPDRTSRSGGHGRSGPLLRTRVDAAPPRHRAPVAASRGGARARPARIGKGPLTAAGVGVAVLLASGAALLADGDDPRPGASASDIRPSAGAPPSPLVTPDAADAALSRAVVAATAADRTSARARAALEEQMAARAEGNLALLRGAWRRDDAAAARAARAVAASSTGLSAVVAAWWDTALAERIASGLDQQSQASQAYAAAVGLGDVAAADDARARMGEVSRELGRVLDGVTQGRIATYVPPQDAAQYRAFVDALEAEDAATAEQVAAWVRGRLLREGTALASGLEGGPS